MKLIIKLFKIFLLAVLSVVVAAVLYSTFDKEIDAAYSKVFWKLPTEIAGVSTADKKSDIFFKLGKYKSACSGDYCVWEINETRETGLIVNFNDDAVTTIAKKSESFWAFDEIPFRDVEAMRSILGEPFIYFESEDFLNRRYTYMLDVKSKRGVTFSFTSNKLKSYMIGNVQWRGRKRGAAEYVIGGKVICPGNNCPYDSKGNLKPQFKDKDFTYFLKN
ncbi:hypothetical protein N9O62_04555 [Burkholderiaceae bacterium]|nr:hypothetical protein [Burkholderiaceae bacterium]